MTTLVEFLEGTAGAMLFLESMLSVGGLSLLVPLPVSFPTPTPQHISDSAAKIFFCPTWAGAQKGQGSLKHLYQ